MFRISSERIQILTMLQDGKISVEEADRLLDAIAGADRGEKFLRVRVTEKGTVTANVRIPLSLLEGLGSALAGVAQAGLSWQSTLAKIQAGIGGRIVEVEEPNQDRKVEVIVE